MRFRWYSYGAVRFGFKKSGILRCGSVQFSDIGNSTVRFGAFSRCREPYGAVGCGFPISSNLPCGAFSIGQESSVRLGAVNCTGPHQTDRKKRTARNPDFFEHFSNIWSYVQNLKTTTYYVQVYVLHSGGFSWLSASVSRCFSNSSYLSALNSYPRTGHYR